ncbi:hypothetical protein WJX72_010604 [[Myrmecia] bisecta]|uniref:Multifunctional methyltransferase subunit TRM112-like protein n=1 Tax=[Myrmecia] bisecta TaxID=41462 RepID=A0AAW1Q7T4_9CHLO
MKLLTHNMLSCHIKGVTNGFPFKIEATEVSETEADYDPDFLRHIFPRLQWPALKEGAESLGVTGLPDEVTEELLQDEDFLKAFHHALLEVTLQEGALVCPETGRKFPVMKGIPNLLLNEDEC